MELTLPDAATPAGDALARRLQQARDRMHRSPSPDRGSVQPGALSAAQRRIWFLDRLQPGSAAYNIPLAWRIVGRLDATALASAIREVTRRHQVLRTCVRDVAGEPVALVRPEADVELAVVEVRSVEVSGAETGLDLVGELGRRPFVLDREPPIRATLVRTAPDAALLSVVLHHIAADGGSIPVLVRELAALYDAFSAGRPSPLSELTLQYRDSVAGESSAPDQSRLDYWRDRLRDAPTLMQLPLDRERPARPTGAGAIHDFTLAPQVSAGIRRLAAAERVTPYAIQLAAFCAVAARWSGQEDLLVGVPVDTRSGRSARDLIGCYVNTVPVRVSVSAASTGRELVGQVAARLLDGIDSALPFDRLVDGLRLSRQAGSTQLIQTLFVSTDRDGCDLQLAGLEVSELSVDPQSAKLDLSLSVDSVGSGDLRPLTGQLTYSTDVFEPASAVRMADQFATVLGALVDTPDLPVAALSLGAAGRPLLGERSDVPTSAGSVLDLIAARVAEYPTATAVADATSELSYAELDRRARRLARRLCREGLGADAPVGILAERSVSTVVAILGVWLAGAAYVPVDPDLPSARRNAVLAAAQCRLLVVPGSGLPLADPPAIPVFAVDLETAEGVAAAPLPQVAPDSLAYIMTTSGSTGTPKAVAVEHRQLKAYVDGVIERLGLDGCASFAVVSTLAADLGHTCLFPALSTGATLRLVNAESAADPNLFAQAVRRQPVDVLKIVPSHLEMLMSGTDPAGVLPRRLLVLGGDTARWSLVDRVREWAPSLCIVNHYGPTEATVGALTQDVDEIAGAQRGPTVPLGRPLPHASAIVLDSALHPVPDGVAGELFLGGTGVARGYLGDPALTMDRFLPDTWTGQPHSRVYRTGDLARRRPDGTLEFLGRIDGQVKIRGHRVEPGDVSATLRDHTAVRDAFVLVEQDRPDGPRLAAFVAADDPNGDLGVELRGFLSRRLPAAMVPSTVTVLDRLPLTPNGKVDRAILQTAARPVERAGREPVTPLERDLAQIWSDVLGVARVHADDDFFDLGGHSLLATQVVARVRQRLGLTLPVASVFEFPTVETLAKSLEVTSVAGDGYEEGEL